MESSALSVSHIVGKLAGISRRPRYAFLVLNLISEVAGPDGKAGPYVEIGGQPMPVRDWLSQAMAPLAQNEKRRGELRQRILSDMKNELPADPEEADRIVDAVIQQRAVANGKTNISRAVSDLVRAGLLKRYYEGWARNHVNRGGQRHAVYVVDAETLAALRRGTHLL